MEETTEILDQGAAQTARPAVERQKLVNSSGILTLGILSIIFAGGVGIILGIIALSMAGPAMRESKAHPEKYTEASIKNANAGKVCAIIGVSIAALVILFLFFALMANS